MASDAQITALLAQPADFKPNFTAEHSVELPHPLGAVFDALGRGETLEPSVRLSDLCAYFRLTKLDHVKLESAQSLDTVRCRGLPPAEGDNSANEEGEVQGGARVLPRQFFVLQEVVPLVFGLYKHTVTITGCLTSDRARNMALYETSATGGIRIWKLRTFEELPPASPEGGVRTKVSERVEGRAPALLRGTVEKETRRAHAMHMEGYHTLFS
ncbi:hypothetical protein DFH06DRAFT_1339705 [Mycena polygramma]|nr:hypothetical protein DFH06DRAFT_1339705 [Mycena polygramma]